MSFQPIAIESPCRLSFTLIDLTGATGRKNGMASMVIEDPSFACRVCASDRDIVEVDDAGSEYREHISDYLGKLRRELGGGHVRIVVDRPIPTHSGFGSKTNTLLSIGKAFAAAHGLDVTTDRLAGIAGRAGTSGGTVNLIDRGGFLVDGGHATPPGFAEAPNKYLLPSRYAGAGRRPPVLISAAFPSWPLLMILPAGRHIHGDAELKFFQSTLPIPIEETRRTAHIVLMNLAPAVLDQDYGAFCNALNAITFESYFKGRQIALQNENLKHVVTNARDNGIDAIGMSSMGPVCFSVTQTPERARAWLDELQARGVVRRHWFTRVANGPAKVTQLPVAAEQARTG
ncbi:MULTISPECIES: beta-ribofuranosylaminobenzene 5'-phosphate synthase family protein [Phyllobacteriaceae]|uniref:beta-ribofuranosylaminobenzene 5'-phosphate synthase family protein n=1 Tax=Phyllobacteriaceae TaxID=69277 RepID=UPI0018EABBB7|nr:MULTISPECIES: beta-ribofuranosylaminobenzene 5'-phosphate synthase family protein [Phyllobacteriaceae]